MTPRQKRIAKAKAAAVAYLLKYPTASARQVAINSGVTWPTAAKLIRERQTPVEVYKLSPVPTYDLPPAGVAMLNEALDVFDKRGKTYGDAATHWADVAALWTILTGHPITAAQAVSMMIGLKQLRLKSTPHHHDSIVDIAGYAAVMANVRAANGA